MIQIIIFTVVFQLFQTCGSQATDTLGHLYVQQDKITLSGFSSGGTFAQQLQFSYSSRFSGIAVFSHTFYRCGTPNGLISQYDRECTKLGNLTEGELYSPLPVHDDIQDYLQRGFIEDPANLKNKRLYIYTGIRNVLFTPRQSLGILSVYERYIGSPGSIFTRVQDANLVLPTNNLNYGISCTDFSENITGSYFIGRCGFSGVTEALNFLLFPDASNSAEAFIRHNAPRGKVSTFDQTEFTKDLEKHHMDTVGFQYVPHKCKNGYHSGRRCYLHFYFHGCLSGREFAGTQHVENSGLLELADKKGIIMIFPQAVSSAANDIGCWDTFGISGRYYATQQGAQVKAVKRMLDRILGKSRASSSSKSRPPPNSSQSSVKWPSHQPNGNQNPHQQPSYFNRNGYRNSGGYGSRG